MNIQVGDSIRCLVQEADVTKDKIYLVIDTGEDEDGFYVMIKDDIGDAWSLYLNSGEFELVTEEPIKVGDWIKARWDGADITKGSLYQVEDYSPDSKLSWVTFKDDAGDTHDLPLKNFEVVKHTPDKLRQIDKPDYYQILPEYQVLDINKALLDKIQESEFNLSLNEAGWYQQAMQYFMRFFAKNGLDDLEKGVYAMNIVIESLKEQQEND